MAKEYIHLPEAKKRLVIGWPGNLQENKMAGDIERRTSQRHRAVQGTYVVTPAKIGHLIDISPEGLSFSSVDRGEWLGEPFEIEILAGDKEFYLGKIMACSVNADQNRNYQPDQPFSKNRYHVKFTHLTKKQKFQLEYFILTNTVKPE